MNAAAKMIHQSSVFQGRLAKVQFSKQFYLQIGLLIFTLVSSLGVVYTINMHRMTCSQLQFSEQEAHQLQLQWGQLLLEQAILAKPEHIEKIATEQLHMILPANKQAFILRAR